VAPHLLPRGRATHVAVAPVSLNEDGPWLGAARSLRPFGSYIAEGTALQASSAPITVPLGQGKGPGRSRCAHHDYVLSRLGGSAVGILRCCRVGPYWGPPALFPPAGAR